MRTEDKAAVAFVLIASVAFLSGREAGISVEKKREAAKLVQQVFQEVPEAYNPKNDPHNLTFPSWENKPGIKQAAPSGTEDHPLYTQMTLEGRVDMLEGEVDFLRTMEQAREERELKAKRTRAKLDPAVLAQIQTESPCFHLTSGRWVAEGSSIRFDTRQKCEDYAAHPIPVNGARSDSLTDPDLHVHPPQPILCTDTKTSELYHCGEPGHAALTFNDAEEYCRILQLNRSKLSSSQTHKGP